MPENKNFSPMMQRYLETKEQYKDCILFYRLGDFYEMFFDDAITAARELEITLTGKDCGQEERAPMAGVPHHAAEMYISKLIAKGYRIFTGKEKNLGANIVAGAFKGCAGAGSVAKAFNENVFLFPFPYKLPDGTDRKKFYTDLRSNMVSKAQISIFISGEKLDNGVLINSPGVMEEYELSKQQGNLIIPVASTGGAALAIWNKMEEDGFNGDIDLYKSLSEELNPDKIVDKIFEILNSYTKKYR